MKRVEQLLGQRRQIKLRLDLLNPSEALSLRVGGYELACDSYVPQAAVMQHAARHLREKLAQVECELQLLGVELDDEEGTS
jgi:GAF domain-containing protein